METYRWAVLGCGSIANELAQAMQSHGRAISGVANRTHANAVSFAKTYGRQMDLCEFKTSQVYTASLTPARATCYSLS